MNAPLTPKPNDSEAIWDLVIEDMKARDALGRRKYLTPLQANNGRDALQDAYEEALDLCCYLRKEIEERKLLEARLQDLERQLGEPCDCCRRNDPNDYCADGCRCKPERLRGVESEEDVEAINGAVVTAHHNPQRPATPGQGETEER